MANHIIFIIALIMIAIPKTLKSQSSIETFSELLEEIKSERDTTAYNTALSWLNIISDRDTSAMLFEAKVNSQLERLKDVLTDYQYANLLAMHYAKNSSIDTNTAKYESIQFATDYINSHDQPESIAEEYTLLFIMRQARVPFRNSDRIYDGIRFYSELVTPAKLRKDSARLTTIYYVLGGFYNRLSLYEKSKYYFRKSLEYIDDHEPDTRLSPLVSGLLGLSGKVNRSLIIGVISMDSGDVIEGEKYLKQGVTYRYLSDSYQNNGDEVYLFINLAKAQSLINPDSSDFYFENVIQKLQENGTPMDSAFYFQYRAANYFARGMLDSTLSTTRTSLALKESNNLPTISPFGGLIPAYYQGLIRLEQNKPSTIPTLLQEELTKLKVGNSRRELELEMKLLADAYRAMGEYEQESHILRELQIILRAILVEDKSARSESYEIEKEMEATSIQLAVLESEARNNEKFRYYLIGIAVLLAVTAITLIVAFLNKRRSNGKLLSSNNELNHALVKLKSTQTQLIHAEKMASLGELTAGIAHEIQNPLNFVNNFSELNTELIEELKEAVAQNDQEEVTAILSDLAENEGKINHHGKRASDIVKSMLQHSRTGSGEKELTDINALADEYLRLSYHGLRAKNAGFNADFKLEIDESLPKVNVIPQDMGRVLLNLINNAFHAVKDIENPQVIVATKVTASNQVQITVSDNGSGIPDSIKEKIFQPFFTTKAAGEGTGLGLSMSYDIMQVHGGTLKVETGAIEGTKFMITLPNTPQN